MPTPVNAARQCLTEEAARALDDAVAVACRRSHTQTTSLHAVSALLALPSSALSDACSRARSGAYSPRLQFRALDLSVGVALDRLPSSKAGDEPPVSNSLMAAIKRSQANQRRHPETFHLYQQAQQQNPSSISCVKVELKHFILSILDDPIVSRVFGEAGFRSSELKLAILRPPPPISRFSRSKCPPPLFLCNFSDWESNRHRSNFPFVGVDNGDENSRRIGEVLVKKKSKNPLLIGACAINALSDFTEGIQRNKHGVLPDSIDGSTVISIEKEIRGFVCEGGSEVIMEEKLKELSNMVDHCRVIVNYGDLKVFVNGGLGDSVKYVVDRLSKFREIYGEKLWLIGAVGDYETYMEFVAQFCLVEKDWDLHLLPITSSKSFNGGSYSKKSLMGSFVPLAGFFPTPSEFQNLTNQPVTRCKFCNEKYEQEVSLILKGGGSTVSVVSDHHSANLPLWLLRGQIDTGKSVNAIEVWIWYKLSLYGPALQRRIFVNKTLGDVFYDENSSLKAKDGNVLKARLMGLQRKWTNICQRLHHNIPQFGSQAPGFEAFLLKNTNKNETNGQDSLLSENTLTNLSSPTNSLKNVNSYSSITSVTTDLGLGTLYASFKKGPEKPVFKNHNKDRLQSFSGSNASNPSFGGQFDEKDFKYLSRVLVEKVGCQAEAICAVSQAISRCRTGNGRHCGSSHRGDVWLGFLGPDRVGKKRIASALAEIVFGSQENLISVDLSSEEDSISNLVFDRQGLKSYDVKFRGKSVVDYIAEELSRKPRSVIFLESLDKADFLAQHSLSRAIRTGKFPDSYGREISVNNMIFVTTSSIKKVNQDSLYGEQAEFSEERILGAKRSQMQILVENVTGDVARISGSNVFLSAKKRNSDRFYVNKRKFIDISESLEQANKVVRACLDLNLPVEENDDGKCESDSGSENTGVWLEDFLEQVDEKVVFESIDFNALSGKILKEIGVIFGEKVGVGVRLEIDEEVMVQMLAASWLSEGKGGFENWIQEVLCKSFVEVKQKHQLINGSLVKLVAFEGVVVENDVLLLPRVCLPPRIVLR